MVSKTNDHCWRVSSSSPIIAKNWVYQTLLQLVVSKALTSGAGEFGICSGIWWKFWGLSQNLCPSLKLFEMISIRMGLKSLLIFILFVGCRSSLMNFEISSRKFCPSFYFLGLYDRAVGAPTYLVEVGIRSNIVQDTLGIYIENLMGWLKLT